jgi:hypothetical protein
MKIKTISAVLFAAIISTNLVLAYDITDYDITDEEDWTELYPECFVDDDEGACNILDAWCDSDEESYLIDKFCCYEDDEECGYE